MGPAADQVKTGDIFEAITRTQMQELPEIVGEIEGRAEMDLVLLIPFLRSDHALEPNARLDPAVRRPGKLVTRWRLSVNVESLYF